MSQSTTLKYLKRVKPKYKLVDEIAKATKISYGSATTNLRKLHMNRFVDRKYIRKEGKGKYYTVLYKYKDG